MIYMPDLPPRKYGRKLLTVDVETLVYLFQVDGSFTLSATGMPADAKCVRSWINNHGFLEMVIESDTFPDQQEGSSLSPMSVTFHKHFPENPCPSSEPAPHAGKP